ncbi:YeeE/YedE thiosulfate transporter family protein [Aurantiacibacter sp. D1-12]|uniref:YeeE/YedE thiosulfate transporter family protein n=1 Tax=Aurantiacibacter sp. D1-12 TaxID=2993658 RepID=UPI00237CC29A|nr:YeeE/YedE thiosulfate transporter family protein [Aurantiacibacter sp. D1-12]MDE1467434.1 YeeE/YedE thiosulfate transporter family protein [Aurantiacibacter sp. D1-12]
MPDMIGDTLLALCALALAFVMGFAIRKGSICLVDAVAQWTVKRNSGRIRAFNIAAAASGCVILPLAWAFPSAITLAPSLPVTLLTLVCGIAFGLGARINGGCAFGTIYRLGSGQVSFAATLVGSVAGYVLASSRIALPSEGAVTFGQPNLIGIFALIVCISIAAPALQRRHLQNLRSLFRRNARTLRPFTAMLVIGVLGGLLYALAGSWTLIAVLQSEGRVAAGQSNLMIDAKAIAGASALVLGAVSASLFSRRFSVKIGSGIDWARHLTGGVIMGAAATGIPGGNGTILVFGMPSGAMNMWASYAAMVLTLIVSFWPMRGRKTA